MLTRNEEYKLIKICDKLEDEWMEVLTLDNLQWLVDKLKETNDELSKVWLELQEAHELNGTLSDQLYGSI